MPVRKCSNGKYRIGSGPCMYKTKDSADRAYRGYLYNKIKESTDEEISMNKANKLLKMCEEVASFEKDEWVSITDIDDEELEELEDAISALGLPKENLVFGNGANDLWTYGLWQSINNEGKKIKDAGEGTIYSFMGGKFYTDYTDGGGMGVITDKSSLNKVKSKKFDASWTD